MGIILCDILIFSGEDFAVYFDTLLLYIYTYFTSFLNLQCNAESVKFIFSKCN